MKILFAMLLFFLSIVALPCLGVAAKDFKQQGQASWYGPHFQGQTTASGETFDMYDLTAAHKYLPLGTQIRVTNERNGKSVVVRINDRGPYAKGRIIDLSKTAAQELGMLQAGTAPVTIETVGTVHGATGEGDLEGIFIVHLATFSNPAHAMQLFDKLGKEEPKRRVLQIIDPQGVTAHVQLGPFRKLSHAQNSLDKLNDPFPDAFVMAELEGSSLRSYLRENETSNEMEQLDAIEDTIDKQSKEAEAKEKAEQKIKDEVDAKAEKLSKELAAPQGPPEQGAVLAACKGAPAWTPDMDPDNAWFVQLAVYRLERNAKAEMERAAKKGNVRVVRNGGGRRPAFQVQAGPYDDKQKAFKARNSFRNPYRDAYVIPAKRMDAATDCVLFATQKTDE